MICIEGSKLVDFGVQFVLKIEIQHWQSFTKHIIDLPSCSTFEYINYQITELFSDEIGESDYILYTLPGQSRP